MCAMMLHNFIRRHQLYYDEFDESGGADTEAEEHDGYDVDRDDMEPGVNATTARELNEWRDSIANAM